MKAQSGKSGKGGAGQKPQASIRVVSEAEYKKMQASRRAFTDAISRQKPGQRAGMAKTRAAAAKKRGK